MIQSMIASAGKHDGGVWATVLGIVTLVITATSVFAELQADLNYIWKAAPQAATVGTFLKARAAGLGLVGTLGFLLLVSLVIGAALQALGSYMMGIMPAAKTLLQIATSWWPSSSSRRCSRRSTRSFRTETSAGAT